MADVGGIAAERLRAFIERIDGGYRVEYRDLLAGVPEKLVAVKARYVFLCAGSVNSTELISLFRIRAANPVAESNASSSMAQILAGPTAVAFSPSRDAVPTRGLRPRRPNGPRSRRPAGSSGLLESAQSAARCGRYRTGEQVAVRRCFQVDVQRFVPGLLVLA